MSKQNNRGRGTQGETPAQEIQTLNTPVVETPALVNAVVGDTTQLRKDKGDQQISTDETFANPLACVQKDWAEAKAGDIIIRNYNEQNPTINIVIRDGVFLTQGVSGLREKTLLCVELKSHEKLARGYVGFKLAEKREITNDAFFLSKALYKSETINVLKIDDETRSLILAGLGIAQFDKGKSEEVYAIDGSKFSLAKPRFHREFVPFLVPYLRDKSETFTARVRTLLDPTLPAVEPPAIHVKETKLKAEKPLTEAQIKRAAKKAEKAKTTQTVTTETPGVEILDAPKPEALIPTPELVETV